MAHIIYGKYNYPIPDEQVGPIRRRILEALRSGKPIEIELLDAAGDASYLYVSQGVVIAVNDWDNQLS